MQLFKGVIRVNANDKSQAYLSLPGLTADIFIKVCWANLDSRMQHAGAVGSGSSLWTLYTSCAETCSWYRHDRVNTLAYPALLVVQGGNCSVCPSHGQQHSCKTHHALSSVLWEHEKPGDCWM